ncbi:MAG: PD-(D/E)XK nuclease family protein [Patescibacteria group bacterium]|nr:PD-(D/E)XK nuclease family protein [Patescibacteria group bacterium]
MSEYYTAKRAKGLYDPNSKDLFKLSRSKIDLFVACPRCFYLDRRLGVGRPPGFPFALNSAVDKLLKKEFDSHRAKNTAHPLMKKYGVEAVPLPHQKLEDWRNNFKGIQFFHAPTNFLVFGAIDDVWQDKNGELIIVDYKSTSKDEEITELNKDWQDGYKRQMEIYQWLFRQNGFQVNNLGYFVYCNGKTDGAAFDAKLEFDITLVPYTGSDAWVEKTLLSAKKCLDVDKIPPAAKACDYCAYTAAVAEVTNK